MGFVSAPRQTTSDFLTSLTNPAERVIRGGFEDKAPRSADEFAAAWESSAQYRKLMQDIDAHETKFPLGGSSASEFALSRRSQQSKNQLVSPALTA